jgi:hypothetical protein
MRSVIRIIRGMDARCSVSPWQLKVNIRWLTAGHHFTPRVSGTSGRWDGISSSAYTAGATYLSSS